MNKSIKEVFLNVVVSFFLLHIITLVSYIPLAYMSLKVEDNNLTAQQIEVALLHSAMISFAIAGTLTVLTLNHLAKNLCEKNKKTTLAIVLFFYLIFSIGESLLEYSWITLSSAAYFRIFKSILPFIIIPAASLLLFFAREYFGHIKTFRLRCKSASEQEEKLGRD